MEALPTIEIEEYDDEAREDSEGIMGRCIINVAAGWAFEAELGYNSCCGLVELCHFSFLEGRRAGRDLTNEFHSLIPEIGRRFHKGIVHLTITTARWSESPGGFAQPEWFVNAVKTYPGVVGMPAPVLNPNSGNQIWMFMLPTGIK